jgi:hypothetical protein
LIVEIILTAGYAFLFCFIFWKWAFAHLNNLPRWTALAVFLVKILVGFVLCFIYTYHYELRTESDSFRYFDDAMVVYHSMFENPAHYFRFIFGINLDSPEMAVYFEQMGSWKSSYNYGITNDNPTVIRLNAIVALFSFGYYQVHTVFFCFFSTIGGIALFRAFQKLAQRPWLLVGVIFFVPTVVFWSSGVLKEAPLIMGVGLLVYSAFQMLFKGFKWQMLLLALLSFLLLAFLKEYVLIALFSGLFFLTICRMLKWRYVLPVFLVSHVVMGLLALNAALFYPPGDLLYVLQKKQTDFYNVAAEKGAGSLVDIPPVGGTADFIRQAPSALYRAYFRPDLREIDSSLQAVSAAENLLLIAAVILAIFTFRKVHRERFAVVLFCFSFVVILGLIIGNTVPVLGAVVRYKMPALPFLFIALLLVSKFSRAITHEEAKN